MKILKLFWLSVLLMAMFLFGCSSEKVEPESNVAEFCAVVTDKNTYNLHLVKSIEIPWDSSWDIPKVVHERCTRWNYRFRVSPPTRCVEGELCPLVGGGGGGICTSTGSARDIQVPLPERRLFLKNDIYAWALKRFPMVNAKDSLVTYFGKEFDGFWSASLQGGPNLEAKFKAKIVGFCDTLPPVAEYCVLRGDTLELRLVENVDYIEPQTFYEGKSGNICHGGFRSEKKFTLDLGKYGKVSKGPFVEELSCDGDVPVDADVNIGIPEIIVLDRLQDVPAEGVVLGRWEAGLTCNSEYIKRVLPFSIRIVGDCPEVERNHWLSHEDVTADRCQRVGGCGDGCEWDENDKRFMEMLSKEGECVPDN